MEHDRNAILVWLKLVLERSGETPTGLARRAGLSPSTLTRFIGDADSPLLGSRSIAKIAHATGVGLPGMTQAAPEANGQGLAEPEGRPYRADAGATPLSGALAHLIAGRNSADAWVLKTDALLLAGYLPGDIVIVDLARAAERGDVVCAQVYRWREGKADTVFRVFEPPYLVAASASPHLRMPLVVDNDRVIIKGVVTECVRAPLRMP